MSGPQKGNPMPDQRHALRATAQSMFQAAIKAADPAAALQGILSDRPLISPGKLIILAIGKAAVPMMKIALSNIGNAREVTAFAVTNYENEAVLPNAELHLAGHPVPDANGAKAGLRVLDILKDTTANDRVIALISGGGSALLPCPVPGVSLEDKAAVNEALLAAGLDIVRMNLVRQQLSQLKGGGLARHAAPAPVTAYILSDVVGDDLRAIASGPTVSPIGARSEARETLQEAGIWESMPDSVRGHLSAPEAPSPEPPIAENVLICSNRKSLEAMVASAPPEFTTRIVNDRLEGNVVDVAPQLIAHASEASASPVALIFGGETTVTLTGTGKGGRNQDLALRFASLADGLKEPWVFLSGGTDGRDGPTDAAGGLVDDKTMERLSEAGVDAEALLANNDSNAALKASGDLLVTGGTGTNVADVQVFLRK